MQYIGFGAVFALMLAGPVSAAAILISGAPGAGVVTITLDGTARANADSSLPVLADATFQSGRDLQFGDYLSDSNIQDTIFATTGNLTISQGTTTVDIVGLFLDEDTSTNSNNPDDFGFRTDPAFNYTILGGDLIFAGSATIPVDINAFNPVIDFPNAPSIDFLAAAQTELTVTIQAVDPIPVPPALPLLGAGLAVMAVLRRCARR